MIRCLVVDDDAEIRSSLQQFLQGFDMSVTVAAGGAEMRRCMAAEGFDVVLLDLMLGDGHGMDLCRWAQQSHPQAAIIMLTAQGDPISRVLGLELGADDYVAKPFEPRELVARIHAVCRRLRKGEQWAETAELADSGRLLSFADWRFDRVLRQLESSASVIVPLSNAEYRLLLAFVERAGRVLSRDQLIELTRAPGVEVNDRSVDLTVSRLRQKLGDNPPRLIRTMRGEGYLFDVQVQS